MGSGGFEPPTSSTPGWHHSHTRRRPLKNFTSYEIIKSWYRKIIV